MTQSSGSAVPATPAGLEREVDAIRQRFDTLQRQQAAGRMTNLLAMIVILVLFGAFAYALYNKYTREFGDQAQVQTVFADELQQLMPEVERHMRTALETAAPRYQEVAVERLKTAGPEIVTAFRDEFKDLPSEAGEEMATQLQAVIDRVSRKVEPDLRKRFPSLSEDRLKAMLEEFHGTHVANQTERLMAKIQKDAVDEGGRVMHVLERFRAPTAEGIDPDALKAEFVIAMLDYVKLLVVNGGQGDSMFPTWDAAPRPIAATQAAAQ